MSVCNHELPSLLPPPIEWSAEFESDLWIFLGLQDTIAGILAPCASPRMDSIQQVTKLCRMPHPVKPIWCHGAFANTFDTDQPVKQ